MCVGEEEGEGRDRQRQRGRETQIETERMYVKVDFLGGGRGTKSDVKGLTIIERPGLEAECGFYL